jgi:hypothetical protein
MELSDLTDLSKTHIIESTTRTVIVANIPHIRPVYATGLLDINTGLPHTSTKLVKTSTINESVDTINESVTGTVDTIDTVDTVDTIDTCKWCHSRPVVPSFVSKQLCSQCSVTKNVLDMMDSMRGLGFE